MMILINVLDEYDICWAPQIGFNFNKYGVLIDEKTLDKSIKYEWFNKSPKEQVFESNTELGKEILLSHGKGLVATSANR